MQNFIKGTKDKLMALSGPADSLEKRIATVVDRATSEMMINPDWGVNMELVDIINTEPNATTFERVFRSLRRRIHKPNPKIQILVLTLLESCVKNTGTEFQTALVISDMWTEVVRLADTKRKADLEVQDKALILVEDCAHALSPPGYKLAYDELKKSGVRFPTRSPQEIGGGFNLPPTARDATAIAGMSAEDQIAVQEALKDLNSQPRSTHPPSPPAYPVHGLSNESSPEKILKDLKFWSNSVELLKDALGSIPKNEPELIYQDYIKDLNEQCKETVPKLKKLIETATNEEILAKALTLNDEVGSALVRFTEMTKKAANSKKPVEEVDQELVHIDDLAVVVPRDTVGGSSSNQQGAQDDPFAMLAAQTPTSPQPNPPNQQKEKDPFEDLITL